MEKLEEEEEEKNGGENEEEEEENEWNDEEEEGGDGNSSNGSSDSSIKDKKASEMAAALMRGFESKWSPALSGIATLDEVLGADNDISSNLDSLLPSQDGSGNEKSTSSSSSVGLSDGMWQHVGWTQMKTLQTRVSKMKQLKTLIYNLGRRPSSTGKFKMKYPPYKYNKDAPLSVSRNPLMPTNLNGLCFSANLQNMLTRDAMLLRGSNKLRRLFLAKYAQQGSSGCF